MNQQFAEQQHTKFEMQRRQRDQEHVRRLLQEVDDRNFRQLQVHAVQQQRQQMQELREAQHRQVQQKEYQKAVGTLAQTHRQFFSSPTDSPGLQPAIQAEPPPRIQEKSDHDLIERQARGKLKLGESLAGNGFRDDARQTFSDVIAKYPDTQAAAKARQLLDQ